MVPSIRGAAQTPGNSLVAASVLATSVPARSTLVQTCIRVDLCRAFELEAAGNTGLRRLALKAAYVEAGSKNTKWLVNPY